MLWWNIRLFLALWDPGPRGTPVNTFSPQDRRRVKLRFYRLLICLGGNSPWQANWFSTQTINTLLSSGNPWLVHWRSVCFQPPVQPSELLFFLYPEHLSPKVLLLDAVPSQEFMQFADLFHSRFQTVDEQTVKKKKNNHPHWATLVI